MVLGMACDVSAGFSCVNATKAETCALHHTVCLDLSLHFAVVFFFADRQELIRLTTRYQSCHRLLLAV